ncbi:MAG TPA: glycine zipper 2TM domain-containing protein [Usitatibacter sp.]|jgi:outer membrane lipoprotein SlyB|nr:glycine zipper 2TM domain-containing protein [Usitatibacter sp.]
MKSFKNFAVLLAAAVLAGACAYPAGSRDYHGYQVMGEQSVRFGVVESVRDVRLHAGESGVGTAGGAVLGGLAGSTVGGGTGQVAGAVGGAILGGILGSNIEHSANERPGVEVTVHLDNGQYISVVQEADEAFRPGDRVRVLSGRGATRVTH